MKSFSNYFLATVTLILITSCYKEYDNPVKPTEETPLPPVTPKYNSIEDFHTVNEIKSQAFVMNATNGGTVIGLQGTEVMIPPNAFVTLSGGPVTGDVSLEFKEIYKKSDMILSAKPTMQSDGKPLKSAGEFFLKATYNGEAVLIAPGANIIVEPFTFGLSADPDMEAFTAQLNPFSWNPATVAGVTIDSTNCQLFISQFLNPPDSGTWYNCDNGSLFAAYQQTSLTLHQSDAPTLYGTQVFLVFDDMNCVLQIGNTGNDFNYQFAPVGLSCMAVAVGVRDGILYTSIMPIMIEPNQTVQFTMSPVTEEFLMAQIQLLD